MFRSNLILLLLVLFAFNCLGQGDIQSQKALIDKNYQENKANAIIFVKLADKNDPIAITGTDIPSVFEFTYYVLKDAAGKIVMISECPFSESADWMISLVHYFNQQGNTFAFDRQSTFLSNTCSEGIITESKAEYYSDNFQLIDKSYKFTDEYGKDLTKDSCQVPVNMEYTVIKNLNDYMVKKKIKISK